jgi:hypothetical protein
MKFTASVLHCAKEFLIKCKIAYYSTSHCVHNRIQVEAIEVDMRGIEAALGERLKLHDVRKLPPCPDEDRKDMSVGNGAACM